MVLEEALEILITNVQDVIRLKFRLQKLLQLQRKHQQPPQHQQQQADVTHSPLNFQIFVWNKGHQQVPAIRMDGREDRRIHRLSAFQRRRL